MRDGLVRRFDPVAVSAESTVVAEYFAEPVSARSFQSEAELERAFIRQLESQAYERLRISSDDDLKVNLRAQLEHLNGVVFSDGEWERFFTHKIAGANEGIVEKTVRVQEDHVQLLERDDGSTKNITLIDKINIHNNRLQVLNQYEVERGEGGARYGNRYDVTILVNGLPMVHVELKRRGVDIREAFNQIDRYQRDSFWAGSGLFEYVQLFVISNGTLTKYYSNTTRIHHLEEASKKKRRAKSSHSFEFTSWWADATNRPIQDLMAFAKTFFAKHALLNILTKYCVLTSNRQLLVMRPYQIVATERIVQKVQVSTNYKKLGTVEAGGYVWHTTGSGKTLTSFKAAQLVADMPEVDRVLFVVDRKDLDYQTMVEYERFSPGSVNGSTNTAQLAKQLSTPVGAMLGTRGGQTLVNKKISVTTIQKLATFIKANQGHEVYQGHIVIIFDECHRSQFGDMHVAITKAFKKYNLFGFTGTPIFSANAGSGGNAQLKTTEQAFGEKLHTYTIVDAIADKNVLPFRMDYLNTIKVGHVIDKQVPAIDTERALLAPERLRQVVDYILEHFDQKTKRNERYTLGDKRLNGFNALFATASIDAARLYYQEFKKQQADLVPDKRLKVGLIYSYGANDPVEDGILAEEDFEPSALDGDARTFLEEAIEDYNAMFGTSYDTSSDKFQNYYKDLSQKLKKREIDLVIVVNMFLTGFDATTLNTLFVDKNLRAHGLIQAYSRTNRILNSVKTYGNIVTFRNLQEETNAALELFGNKDAKGIVLLKPYGEYYSDYAEKVHELLSTFQAGEPIISESAQKDFIQLYGAILKLQNILTSFDEFDGQALISERQEQDYRSIYLDLWNDYKRLREADKEPINEDVVFEIELIKQVEINIDYILMLVEKYQEQYGNGQDKEIRSQISRAIDSSPSLRNKKDLIEDFVDQVTINSDVEESLREYIAARSEQELTTIITEERLKPDETRSFVTTALRDGEIQDLGTQIMTILPPVSRFARPGNGDNHGEKKKRVLERLRAFVDRFFGLVSVEK
ncbi:type I restriction endonuclease subunit R [Flaviflexus salsibiostraticola]|uniref:Type I restriction enzyme endonuclease subunit n=1 Tax=Flaviflexus salsibiostraticola TaxID=1282737 RepID=A0A3S8ZAU0_9ACTO|nr:type I restriction endonuclease subunit R [Flaviflexus salsibiostraticola]AZN30608.1 type I restriction endonuclease subunit R [Flaviflexus salsibiostraticola]